MSLKSKTSNQSKGRRLKAGLVLLASSLATLAITALSESVTFNYDTAGRLTSVSQNATNIQSFQYDSSGNLTRSVSQMVADSDGDGMADSYELFYFDNLLQNGSGDFDHDGMSDVAEYFAGTVPTNSASLLLMDRVVTNNLVQTTVRWFSVSGKTYRLQYKNWLGDAGWNDLPGDVTANGVTSTKTDGTKAGEPQRFYRVQVVP